MTDDTLWDAARRLSDAMGLHVIASNGEAVGHWLAVRLTDGSADPALYDTRADAIAHQTDPEYHCYILVQPGGISPREAAAYLRFNRALFDAGFRMPDPTVEFVMPMSEGKL